MAEFELLSDLELLKTTDREPAAFGVLYERHVHAVLRFLYRRTVDPHLAADLTAETFAAAYIGRRKYRPRGSSVEGWLLGIARHELSHALRRERADDRARSRLGLERVEIDDYSAQRIEELADLEPLRGLLREALLELPSGLREAVRLRVGLDLPYEQVAAQLGCSEGAARVRVSRGLTKLESIIGTRAGGA